MSSKRSRSRFPFACGCKDSMNVSVPVPLSDTSEKSAATSKDPPSFADTQTATTETTFSSSFEDYEDAASSSAPSLSGLLRQLSELEKNVMEWAPPIEEDDEQEEEQVQDRSTGARRRRHRRCRSEGGGRVEESVAVVKESEDPLADFRRSMLQMIVEKEIVGGEELRELLRKFLQLNSPRHHDVILRAFAEIWNEVFSGYEDTPDPLRRSRSNYYPRRMQQIEMSKFN